MVNETRRLRLIQKAALPLLAAAIVGGGAGAHPVLPILNFVWALK